MRILTWIAAPGFMATVYFGIGALYAQAGILGAFWASISVALAALGVASLIDNQRQPPN